MPAPTTHTSASVPGSSAAVCTPWTSPQIGSCLAADHMLALPFPSGGRRPAGVAIRAVTQSVVFAPVLVARFLAARDLPHGLAAAGDHPARFDALTAFLGGRGLVLRLAGRLPGIHGRRANGRLR